MVEYKGFRIPEMKDIKSLSLVRMTMMMPNIKILKIDTQEYYDTDTLFEDVSVLPEFQADQVIKASAIRFIDNLNLNKS